MQKFLMFGKYSADSVKGISAERTSKATSIVKEAGGELNAIYALLGTTDIVLIVDMPSIKEAAKVSLALTRLTGIGFVTSPALSAAEFDAIAK